MIKAAHLPSAAAPSLSLRCFLGLQYLSIRILDVWWCIYRSMANGRRFIRSIQRPDGSWYGSWGVCFTYGEPDMFLLSFSPALSLSPCPLVPLVLIRRTRSLSERTSNSTIIRPVDEANLQGKYVALSGNKKELLGNQHALWRAAFSAMGMAR